jgi:hypothetical protein
MDGKLRTAYVLRYEDGTYVGYHKKPSTGDDRYNIDRKVDFDKARLYPSRQSAGNAKQHRPSSEIVSVYITEMITIKSKVEETV